MKKRSNLVGLVSVVLMVVFLLLASCSSGPASPPASGTVSPPASGTASSPASPTAKADAKPSGSLKIAVSFGAGQLDPLLASAQNYSNLAGSIFDTLVFLDSNNQLQPGIAERWEIAPDGLSQTFYIRKGVKFHDGSDLTGEDVKFSLERMVGPTAVHMDAGVVRGQIASIEVKDPYTVLVRTKAPMFELLKGEGTGGMFAVMPKKYIQEKGEEYFATHLVGSGPWKFVKWEAATRLELDAVESHWRAVPKFKNLTLLNIPEEAAKVAQLKTGELDMSEVAPDSVAGLKSAGLRIVSYDGGGQYFGYIWYDFEQPDKNPLGNVKNRKALQLAINQKELADSLFGGNGGPYTLFFVSPKASFWDSNLLKPDPFDPEGAKKLAADAGYPNGFSVKLFDVGGGGLLSQVNQAVSGYWRKAGITAETTNIAYSAFFPKFIPKPTPEIFNGIFTFLGSERREFDGMPTAYHSTKGSPKNHKNAKLDELIDKVPTIKDPAEKKKAQLEATQLAKNEYSTLAIVAPYTNIATGSKVGDFKPGRLTTIQAVLFETITQK